MKFHLRIEEKLANPIFLKYDHSTQKFFDKQYFFLIPIHQKSYIGIKETEDDANLPNNQFLGIMIFEERYFQNKNKKCISHCHALCNDVIVSALNFNTERKKNKNPI